MRRRALWLAAALVCVAAVAVASPDPPWSKGNNCSGTIASGGTAQAVTTGVPFHGYEIQNLSSDPLCFSEFTTSPLCSGAGSQSSRMLNAGTAGSSAGGYYATPSFYSPAGTVSIIGATTGDKFFCAWW